MGQGVGSCHTAGFQVLGVMCLMYPRTKRVKHGAPEPYFNLRLGCLAWRPNGEIPPPDPPQVLRLQRYVYALGRSRTGEAEKPLGSGERELPQLNI